MPAYLQARQLHSDSDVGLARLTRGKAANAVVCHGDESDEGLLVSIKCVRSLVDLNPPRRTV